MKILFRILDGIDLIALIVSVFVRIWWNNSDPNEPGLAAMINISGVNVTIIVSAVLFVLLTVAVIVTSLRK